MSNKFNEKEWFSAVYLAMIFLEVPPRKDHGVTQEELNRAAHEYLQGLIARADGEIPALSARTRELTALLQAEVEIWLAQNGGGLQ